MSSNESKNSLGIPVVDPSELEKLLRRKIRRMTPILSERVKQEEISGIRRAYKDKGSVMIWGDPGIGKSEIIEKLAEEMGDDWGCKVYSLSIYDQSTLQGMPLIDHERKITQFYPLDTLPNGKDKKYGILFLDEYSLAPRSVQTIAMQLVLDHRLGDYILPPGWIVIAAGNQGFEDGCETEDMPKNTSNRFSNFKLVTNIECWRNWAIGNNVHSSILSFLNFAPHNLSNLSSIMENSPENVAFASPRSWVSLSCDLDTDLIKDETIIDANMLSDIVASHVGNKASTEYMAYIKLLIGIDFNLEDILNGKYKKKLNFSKELNYYIVTSCVSLIKSNLNKKYEEKNKLSLKEMIVNYMSVVVKNKDNELSMISIKMLKGMFTDEKDKREVMEIILNIEECKNILKEVASDIM